MSDLLRKLQKLPAILRLELTFDLQQNALFKYFKVMPRQDSLPSSAVVLVQCAKDPIYFGLFGQISSSLSEQQPIRVEQYVLPGLSVGESKSISAYIKSRLFNTLSNLKWIRLYNSFCEGVGYSSTSFRPINDMADLLQAWKFWRELKNRNVLVNLVIDGIAVGDLVNDSFLRFKPAPTVDMKDIYLLILLWQTYRGVRRAESYFSRVKPKLYLTSYSTYIQHGIPVRVALKHQVRVFSFSNFQEFAKELSVTDWFHTKNPDNYAKNFLAMDANLEKITAAEAGLVTRLSGGVDSATAYMRRSSYAETGEAVPDVRGAVVVFLHDFYDSPHVYRDMVFPDFWEWICFTIEMLGNSKAKFFIKPHPNQISLSEGVLSELKSRYPEVAIISSGITNKQLAEAGMSCAVTVYGTVAHEMAFLGVPTIASARHPHISFDFCRTAKSRDEYSEMLHCFDDVSFDKEKMRKQSLIFYYMHNLNLEEKEKILLDMIVNFHIACAKIDVENSSLIGYLEMLSTNHGYKKQISKWAISIEES
jgi:hypothetical protein